MYETFLLCKVINHPIRQYKVIAQRANISWKIELSRLSYVITRVKTYCNRKIKHELQKAEIQKYVAFLRPL